ncbi:MAG: hypothetical protein QXX08_07225 [Candidatus Bathyarchaeia archaeon]
MEEPIGRKSVRKTLENLKTYVSLKSDLSKLEEKFFYKVLDDFRKNIDINDRKHIDFLSVVIDYTNSVSDLIRTLSLYIEALESYISELDETFDNLLEDARKMAEQQIQEMPKDKPPFYG